MDTMSALIFHKPGEISVEELDIPKVGPGDILMKVHATSICYSDIRVFKGEKKATSGVIPGHETAGEIVESGSQVEGYSKGERITICPILACGECYFCLVGKRNRCINRTTLGYEENGGLADYLLIPERLIKLGHIIRLPDDLSYEVAALTEPFACALNSVETCRLMPGGSVLIIGAGPMGIIHVLLAKAIGCSQIIVSDLVDSRLEAARKLGATLCVNPQRDDLRKMVLQATDGLGADAVILSVGTVGPVNEGLELVRKQGYFNMFGGFPPGSVVQLDPNRIHYDEIFLTGTQNATPEQYLRACRLLSVIPNAAQVVTHKFGAKDAEEAYAVRLRMEGLKSAVLY